jgi:pimeloyl-ACP methyl ester carboxylesterase
MSSSSTPASTPEGPRSVSGAPNLPEGFPDTFTSRYIDTGGLRQHAVIGGEGPPLLVHGWPQDRYDTGTLAADPVALMDALGHQRFAVVGHGAESWGEAVGNGIKPAADDVPTVVIPGAGHWVAEQAPEEMPAA